MLLSPVMERIGKEEGMNLSGEEIFNHPSLRDQKIRYDYRKMPGGLKKVDLLFEELECSEKGEFSRPKRSWTDGEYI